MTPEEVDELMKWNPREAIALLGGLARRYEASATEDRDQVDRLLAIVRQQSALIDELQADLDGLLALIAPTAGGVQ